MITWKNYSKFIVYLIPLNFNSDKQLESLNVLCIDVFYIYRHVLAKHLILPDNLIYINFSIDRKVGLNLCPSLIHTKYFDLYLL